MTRHYDCCFLPMLELLAKTVRRLRLSLRGDHLPPFASFRNPELAAPLPDRDFPRARAAAREARIELVD
jgi:hypothetical protein